MAVQLGRRRLVGDRYNQLFFQDPANPENTFNSRAAENFGNVQTRQTKEHNLKVQFAKIGLAFSSIWFCAQIFFGEHGGDGLIGLYGKTGYPSVERVAVFGGLTYVAGHLLIAMKSLARAMINY